MLTSEKYPYKMETMKSKSPEQLRKNKMDNPHCCGGKIIFVFIFIFNLLIPHLYAEEELEEYFRIALERSPQIGMAKKQSRLSQYKIREAKRDFFPKLTGEYRRSVGETITDDFEARSYALQLEQPLLDSGKRRDILQRERLGFEISQDNSLRVENDLRFEVAKAYYKLVRWKMEIGLQEELLGNLKDDLDLATRLHQQELITQTEFLAIQSQYNLLTYQISSLNTEFSLAELAFRQVLNLAAEEETPKFSSHLGREAEPLKITLQECISLAFKHQPEISIWEKTSKSAELDKHIARRENRPQFSLNSSYGRSGEAFAAERLDMVDEWSLMGKVSWLFGGSTVESSNTKDKVLPKRITDTTVKTDSNIYALKFGLLDNLGYYSKKEEADITHGQSVGELMEKRKEIERLVKEAYLNCEKAINGIKANLERLDYEHKQIANLQIRFQVQEVSLAQVSEARASLSREISSYISSLANYYLAKASLGKAIGYSEEL